MTRALVLLALLAACGARQDTSRITADDAIFYVKSNVRDANVYVDGQFIGPVGIMKGGIAVAPGMHRIEVRHADYFSGYVELELKRAERRKLDVTLAPILP